MNNENLRPFQKGNKFGKGRIKGSKNRKTVLSAWMNFWYQYDKQIEKENANWCYGYFTQREDVRIS